MDEAEKLQKIEAVIAAGTYQDTWESLQQYQQPEWFQNAKFGIFIHWGIYSVPAFGSEWYSRNMYIQGSKEFEYHRKTYGPHSQFGYKDFIPMFRAEYFNAEEWTDLFVTSGARYIIPVAEHHDGFQMYRSELSKWNAWEMGPKRDILGELRECAEKKGLISGASSHRVEHWFFMGHGKEFDSDIKEPMQKGDFYWPAMPEPNHHDLYSEPTPSQEFLEDWLLRVCEIIDNYHPRILYFDWWIEHSAVKPYLRKMAAYYYNRAQEWGQEVVICYKHDAFLFGTAVVDIERGQFSEAKPYHWQTDTAVALNSWCYTAENRYKKASAIVQDLVDIVSKNGNLLLNIGPKADGTIPQEDKNILTAIGNWLKVNGEAIYHSKVWRTSGEGPTPIIEGQFSDAKEKEFTSQDIRYTVNGSSLYATVLKTSEDGNYLLTELALRDASSLPVFHGILKDVTLLGFDTKVSWKRTEKGLELHTDTIETEFPIVFKITLD